MKANNRKTKKKKNRLLKIIIVLLIFLLIIGILIKIIDKKIKKIEKEEQLRQEQILINEITTHYNLYVKTNKESILYDNNANEIGKINKDIEIELSEININKDVKYFELKYFEGYYIKYEDVVPIENINKFDDRYKNYILFNENIVTKEKTTFYDEKGNFVYEFNKSFDLPIIIKDTDKYGVEYNNRILYIKYDDVAEIKYTTNTDLEKANSIRVIVYHSFYDKNVESEAWCRNSICHSTEQIESHAKYISENNYFTLTMNELGMYIDGKINFPKKSVFITIDDGLLAERGIATLEKYELNASVFLITSYYVPSYYGETKYIEFHSHGDNIHNVGQCPGGQGGGIKCLEKELLLKDLTTSREKLNGSTAFCYPFYEYNSYSIEMLKQAGFNMAFAGLRGDGKVHVGTDKFQIPRYTITSNVTVNELANIIK